MFDEDGRRPRPRNVRVPTRDRTKGGMLACQNPAGSLIESGKRDLPHARARVTIREPADN
jgi:hypothetical protein